MRRQIFVNKCVRFLDLKRPKDALTLDIFLSLSIVIPLWYYRGQRDVREQRVLRDLQWTSTIYKLKSYKISFSRFA